MNKQIALTPVESSQIAAIGHHPETNTLAIQFSPRRDGSPGSIYHYANFTADDFASFKAADSIGSYFGRFIKPLTEKHPFVKVEQGDAA